MPRRIAIDGPAGAGKSTIAKIVAKTLGFVYIDTGAMYRAVALKAIKMGLDILADKDAIVNMMDDIDIRLGYEDGVQHIYLDGEDVSNEIRTPKVSKGASDVAVIGEVRAKLVDKQRELAAICDCIMDGRDIGTCVLPDAEIKIFLTATPEDRAQRRYEEMLQKGMEVDYESVLTEIKYRDKNDSSREVSPLRPAEDSEIIDTTGNTLDESIELLTNYIKSRL